MIKRIVLLCVAMVFLVGCGVDASTDEFGVAPKSVDQELWNDAHKVVNIIHEMAGKKEETTEAQNEIIIKFIDDYFVSEEEFDTSLQYNYSQEERIIIKQTYVTVLTFRVNMFTLETTGEDKLTQTYVEIEKFNKVAESFQND